MINATDCWISQVKHILNEGSHARDTLEVVSSGIRWKMSNPLVVEPKRKVSYRFATAEAAYIISGNNRVGFLVDNGMKSFGNYSDDGVFQTGAYGPPFVDQLPYIIDTIKNDRETRQAVISIWRPRPYKSKDIPCTLTLQFLIRDDKLHCVVNMRSSDVWRGLVYDMFCFSCMAGVVAHYVDVAELGVGYLHAGSSHLYARDYADAINLVNNPSQHDGGPTIGVMSQDDMYDWLMQANSVGDVNDCLIAMYGGEE